MKNKIETLLDEEIRKEIELIGKLNPSDEEYTSAVNGVSKLLDKYIEIEKHKSDISLEEERIKENSRLKWLELDQNKKDQYIKNGLNAISFVGSISVLVWGALKSWQFEKDGIVTSSFGKSFIKSISNLVK